MRNLVTVRASNEFEAREKAKDMLRPLPAHISAVYFVRKEPTRDYVFATDILG